MTHTYTDAEAFRNETGQPTQACPGCPWAAVGPTWARVLQFHAHWLNCPRVTSLSFHEDGSLAGVEFR